LTAEKKAIVKKPRTYLETRVQPIINKCWSDDVFAFELLPSFKEPVGGFGDRKSLTCPGTKCC
jgi:glutaryl-CoA dehydrogenase